MNQVRSAIVFGSETAGISPVLRDTLRQLNLNLLLPHQLSSDKNGISIIIIERPASYAETICSNLREIEKLSGVPILIIPEGAAADASRFKAFDADVLPPAVTAFALRSYLEKKLLAPQAARERPETEKTGSPSAPAMKQAAEKATPPRAASPGPNHPLKQKLSAGETGTKEASKMVKTVGDLKDDIPSSQRLLPAAGRVALPSKNGVRCERCQRWQARGEDAVCSRCGNSLIALELSPEVLTFEPRGNHKVGKLLELRNAGQNPLRLLFDVQADEHLAGRFALHAHEALLDGQAVEDQRVVFDANGIDLKSSYEGVLEVSTNEAGARTRKVRLVVEQLPKPKVVAHTRYIYAIEIKDQVWNLTLANNGGGTLELEGLRLDVPKEEANNQTESIALELLEAVGVRGGQSSPVRARVPTLTLKLGKYPAALWWKFRDLEPLKLNITLEVIQPPKLVLKSEELDFGPVSTRRTKTVALKLQNSGGEDLTVSSIEVPAPWLSIADEIAFPYVIVKGENRSINFTAIGSDEIEGIYQERLTIHSDSYQSGEFHVPVYVDFVEPQPYEHYIGVDFGTTASCVAILDRNGEPTAISLVTDKENPYIMPSALYFKKDGSVLTGWEALEESMIDPANTVTSFKRALGSKQERELAGRKYNPTDLTALVIQQLVRRTEEGLFNRGEFKIPRRAVVTVPVGLIDQQKHTALLEACDRAGLETYSRNMVINEAHAVALYYYNKRMRKVKEGAPGQPLVGGDNPERVLVFDFGGGTLDCELIEIERSQGKPILRVLAPGGDPRLGGEDIDWALVRLLASKAKQAHPEFDDNCLLVEEQNLKRHYRKDERIKEAALRSRAAFKRAAEEAKKTFCNAPVSEVSFQVQPLLRLNATWDIPYLKGGFEAQLQREEFERVLEPFLVRAVKAVEDVCIRAEVEPKDIHTVLHAGRTSRIPQVKERIQELLGAGAVDRSELIEPKVCVALGAAFWGKIKDRLGANVRIEGSAIQRMYDIGYAGTDDSLDEVFVPIFPAQAVPPSEVVIEVPRSDRDVFELPLVINRGKSLHIWGNTDIEQIGVARIVVREVKEESISVRFYLDEKGMIQVSYKDQVHVFEHEDK